MPSLDSLLLGFNQNEYPYLLIDHINIKSSHSNLLNKSNRKLYQNSHRLHFSKSFACLDDKLASTIELSSQKQTTFYKFDDHSFNIVENFDDWLISNQYNNVRFSLGNHYQSLGFNSYVNVDIYRSVTSTLVNLDLQSELDSPLPDQLKFNYKYQQEVYGVRASQDNLSLGLSTIKDNDKSLTLEIGYVSNFNSHAVFINQTELSESSIPISDSYNDYGGINWFSKYSSILIQNSFNVDLNLIWFIDIYKSSFSFESTGGISLADLVGPSSNILGANWFWGVQGNFKSLGVSAKRQWISHKWKHTIGLAINKVTPYLDSKLYKSLLFIGLPTLEEQDTLDFKYAYLSQLNYQSQYMWDQYAVTFDIKQLLPIYESKLNQTSSNDVANNHSNSNNHVGFQLSASFEYYF